MMIFGISSVALSAEEYTIQTISAKKEASITPAFEKKVQKSHLPITKKKEGACNVVTVGKYPSAKAAQGDLKMAKAISKDAFVRPINRTVPKGCENGTAATDSKKNTVEAKAQEASHEKVAAVVQTPVVAASAPKETVAHEPSKAVEAHPVAVKQPVVSVAAEVKPEPKSEPCKAQPCENVTNSVYVYDKNLARKSDIHEAIEYYKHSPYHTFKPVLTQR